MSDDEIDQEIKVLLERRKKLLHLSTLRRQVNDLERGQSAAPVTILLNTVIEVVAREFQIDPKLMMSKCRTEEVCVPRQTVSYVALRVAQIKPIQIAREFKVDHNTISNAVKAITARCETISGFRERTERIQTILLSQLSDTNQ